MENMKPNSFSIVKLEPGNIDLLMDFFLSNGQLKSENFFPHPFSKEYLIYLILNRTKDYYCMGIMDGKAVVYGLLRGWEEGYSIPSLGVAVDREYRHYNLGRLMCNYLHVVAKLRGCEKVRLRVHKENIIARKLYESLGYVFKEEVDDHYEGFLEL